MILYLLIVRAKIKIKFLLSDIFNFDILYTFNNISNKPLRGIFFRITFNYNTFSPTEKIHVVDKVM